MTYSRELCKEYQKQKLSKSALTLFKLVVESMDAVEQSYDKDFIISKTKEILKEKFKKNYYEYQIKRMGMETDDAILEKFEFYKYYYFKTFQETLTSKFPFLKIDSYFTDLKNHKDVILESSFDIDLITKSNFQKEKKSKLTESTAKLFLGIFEKNDLYPLTNINNLIFLISDELVDRFAETALDYQTSRMGLSSTSEIIEKINWFCYFYKEELLNVIYQKTDDEELIRKLRKTYDLF
ncbi:hypothetical protein [Clostridium sp.]|uniref:hypothetical protein n=1 Tax=Clostridium sp. TaxID=1506 RepID=UPI001B4F8E15|nr:hypothetical protein [Clostridium sp.]MBP3916602.1 hypothetical protein [Clostridium sp.]